MNTLGIVIVTTGSRPDWLRLAYDSCVGIADQIEVVHNNYGTVINKDGYRYRGIADALNSGILALNTDWIMRLDDDNLLIAPSARTLLQRLKHEPGYDNCELISVVCEFFGDVDHPWCEHTFGYPLSLDGILQQNQVAAGSWFRKSLWRMIGQFEPMEFEDWRFWIRCARLGLRHKHYAEPVYKHRVHNANLGQTLTDEELAYWNHKVKIPPGIELS